MELKFVCAERYDAEEQSSNRTFMELKSQTLSEADRRIAAF